MDPVDPVTEDKPVFIAPAGDFIGPGHSYGSVTDKISNLVLGKIPKGWFVGLAIGLILLMGLNYGLGYLFFVGVGMFGINIPVAWAFAITNFVWWIGIGHAGTLISAF